MHSYRPLIRGSVINHSLAPRSIIHHRHLSVPPEQDARYQYLKDRMEELDVQQSDILKQAQKIHDRAWAALSREQHNAYKRQMQWSQSLEELRVSQSRLEQDVRRMQLLCGMGLGGVLLWIGGTSLSTPSRTH